MKELNKTLPEGVKVTKSLFGEEYGVVNEIDSYSFKVPAEWKGVDEIVYTPERIEGEYISASIELAGREGSGRIVVINRFRLEDSELSLDSWAEDNFESYGLIGDFTKDNIKGLEVVKTQESVNLGGMFVYFLKKDAVIYAITGGSEEFIQEIILNGQW